jgi:RNA polymerase sigma-70 factor (ECF subfamily)
LSGYSGFTVHFHTFDDEYLRRLRDGDSQVEQHFASYFGELIHLKLRRRVRTRQLLEDIRQETLCRVLRAVREKNEIEDARKLGAFVAGVCHYVTVELSRSENRYEPSERDFDERPDTAESPDAPLINEQRRQEVQKVLAKLENRDRKLLRAVFLEELSADEVCRRFQIERDYLRVLIFRAKARFRQAYTRQAASGT